MKILARIRQLLADKEADSAPEVANVPLPIAAPPEPTPRPRVEHPSAPRTVPSARVVPRKVSVRLEGEGIAQPTLDPSGDIIRHELERLRSSGPSHLALIATDGSYLQAAGNAKRMTVEGHVVSAQGTTHVVLGRQGSPGPATTLASTAGPIEVLASEVWAAPEVSDLFAEFAETGSVSPDLSRRDITASIAIA